MKWLSKFWPLCGKVYKTPKEKIEEECVSFGYIPNQIPPERQKIFKLRPRGLIHIKLKEEAKERGVQRNKMAQLCKELGYTLKDIFEAELAINFVYPNQDAWSAAMISLFEMGYDRYEIAQEACIIGKELDIDLNIIREKIQKFCKGIDIDSVD